MKTDTLAKTFQIIFVYPFLKNIINILKQIFLADRGRPPIPHSDTGFFYGSHIAFF